MPKNSQNHDTLMKPSREYTVEERAAIYDAVSAIMYNDGIVYNEQGRQTEVVLKDLVTKEDLLPLMTEAITHVMLEEIEPMSVIYDSFFSEIRSSNIGQHLILHNIGPLSVQPIGEYGEYPETALALDQDGMEINLRVQRYGIELRVHEDVVTDNLLPIISMWIQRARNAFVRNREYLSIQELKKQGVVVFDNNDPSSYTHEVKSYSGRSISGAQNGTMSLNDLMEVYVSALLEGFTIDTVAMNPFAWQTFMTDPEMKEIVLNNNTVVSFRPPNGAGAIGRFRELQGPNNLGLPWAKGYGNNTLDPTAQKLGVNPFSNNLSILGAQYNIKPRYLPTPLKIVVSPFVPLSKIGNTYVTDVIFAESGEAGLVLREGDPIVRQFNVEEKEAIVVRMREGLGYGVLNMGKAIRIAKNVVIDRNYVFQNTNSVSLSALDQNSSLGPWT